MKSNTTAEQYGLWVPIELWEIKELTAIQRLVLAEITALDNGEGCYAGNQYLAARFNKSERHFQKILAALKKDNWLYTLKIVGKQRFMRTVFSQYDGRKPRPVPPRPKTEDNPKTGTPRRDVKGVWIPPLIWNCTELSMYEKLILCELDSLDCGNGCWASNQWIADRFGMETSHVRATLSRLRTKKWIIDLGKDDQHRYLRVSFSRHENTEQIKRDLAPKPKPKRGPGRPKKEPFDIVKYFEKYGYEHPLKSLRDNTHGDTGCHPINTTDVSNSKSKNPLSPPPGRGMTACGGEPCMEEPSPYPDGVPPTPGNDTVPPHSRTSRKPQGVRHEDFMPRSDAQDPETRVGAPRRPRSRKEKADVVRAKLADDVEADYLGRMGFGSLADESDATVLKFAKYRADGSWRDGDAERVFTVMFPKMPGADGQDEGNLDARENAMAFRALLFEPVAGYKRPPEITNLKTWVDGMVHTKGSKLSYLDYADQIYAKATGLSSGPANNIRRAPGTDGRGDHWVPGHFELVLMTKQDGVTPAHPDTARILERYDHGEVPTTFGESKLEAMMLEAADKCDPNIFAGNMYSGPSAALRVLLVIAAFRPDAELQFVDMRAFGQALDALAYNPGIADEMSHRLGDRWNAMLRHNVVLYEEERNLRIPTWRAFLVELRRDGEVDRSSAPIMGDSEISNPFTPNYERPERCALYDAVR